MAKKKETISIDDQSYVVEQLGAVEGMRIYQRLVKALGPVAREALAQAGSLDTEAAQATLVIRALELLPDDLMSELADKFSRSCHVKVGSASMPLSTADLFDQHFAGRYGHLTKWIIACAKFNFADFLAKPASSAGLQSPQTQ